MRYYLSYSISYDILYLITVGEYLLIVLFCPDLRRWIWGKYIKALDKWAGKCSKRTSKRANFINDGR